MKETEPVDVLAIVKFHPNLEDEEEEKWFHGIIGPHTRNKVALAPLGVTQEIPIHLFALPNEIMIPAILHLLENLTTEHWDYWRSAQ